ncbi:glycosyl hydrolase family 5, partial [Streptomyces albidoflavus]
AYTYTVRAKDAAGNVSPPSAALAATTDEGGGSTGALKVQYRTSDTSPTDNQIRMGLQVVNTGQNAVNLADVKLRYWFTPDGSSAVTSTCDWAQTGCGGVTHTVKQAGGSAPGASHYVEVGFASGSLAPGAATGEIQLRLNKADWSNFDERDDYSRSTSTGFTDHAKIGLYLGTALTWGTAP